MSYFIHPLADCQTTSIGENSRVWQFVVILPEARIGAEANICSHCLIENDVIIGDRVTLKSGVQLWDGLRIDDDVFIGPNVNFTNTKFPRTKEYPECSPITTVGKGTSIGGATVINPMITMEEQAMVTGAAIVAFSVPRQRIWRRQPGALRRVCGAKR